MKGRVGIQQSRVSRLLLIAAIALACQAWSLSSASAFSLLNFHDGDSAFRWSDERLAAGLTYSIYPSFLSGASGDAAAAVQNAFATWEAAAPLFDFTQGTGAVYGPYGGSSIDIWSAPSSFRYGSLSFNGALALTIVGISNGAIVGADIFFNEGYSFSDAPGSGEYDIESIALHEIGHVLGLDHPDIGDDLGLNFDFDGNPVVATGGEVMNSTIAAGEISRTLTLDDLVGLEFLYPSTEASFTSSTVTATSGPTPSVPEPQRLLLLASGLTGLLTLGRTLRRRQGS